MHQLITYMQTMKLSSTAMAGIKITAFTFLLMAPQVISQSPPDPPSPDPYPYVRFSPQMAIIIVVLIAALFFMGFFSIYIRQCSQSTTVVGRNPNPVTGRSRRVAARGLDPSVIEHFPTFPYLEVKELKIGKGALECAVCLMEFEDDETLRLIPKCDHVFHPDCIDAWLASHTTCPVCRSNLVPELGDSAVEHTSESDLEAQNHTMVDESEEHEERALRPPEPEVINVNEAFNRNRTRGSLSSGTGRPPKFPRSHSTGHSLVQPGQNMERFTLRLPAEARKQLMNRQLNRATSLLVFSGEDSSRRGYVTGSSRGKSLGRFERLDRAKSDRWVFTRAPPFLTRASSILSPRGIAKESSVGSSRRSESSRPPV